MKRRIHYSVIAITCFGVLCPITANAENPLDKLIPRGTLFKKLKQELIGDKAPTPTPRRVPTPATAQSGLDRRQSQSQTPSKNTRQTQPPKTGQRPQPNLATRPLPPVNNYSPTQRPTTQGQRRAGGRAAVGPTTGFGVIVQMAKNNQMVVTRLDPQGNAIQAGLKPGDIVKAVGSVKLTSVQEYQQITKGLKPGDQMEFEIVRRGRPQKTLVAYGTPSDLPDSATEAAPTISPTAATVPYVDSTVNLEGVPSVLDSTIQPAARVSRLPSVVAVPRANEKRLQRTIESQRAKMERMEQELEMLRKTNAPAIRPTENNWALPQLSAPN